LNLTDYTYLLNRPDAVTDKHTADLEKIVSEFPFFQSARALRLKGLYNQNSFQYNYALKVTAAYTTERGVLFDFITSDTFTAIHKGLYEQKLAELYNIEVKGSKVVDQTEALEPAVDKIEQSILTSIKESEIPYEEPPVILEEEVIIPEEITPDEITPDEIKPVEIIPEEIKPTDLIYPEVVQKDELPEEKLGLGKPFEFSPSEKHSFSEWLQLSKIQPIQREAASVEEITTVTDSDKKKELIDRFIATSPKIPPVSSDSKSSAVSEPYKEDNSALMTETLARVYLEQKKYQKAIRAYEILILKYPEKSIFFADRISDIKNLQQNNTQQ